MIPFFAVLAEEAIQAYFVQREYALQSSSRSCNILAEPQLF